MIRHKFFLVPSLRQKFSLIFTTLGVNVYVNNFLKLVSLDFMPKVKIHYIFINSPTRFFWLTCAKRFVTWLQQLHSTSCHRSVKWFVVKISDKPSLHIVEQKQKVSLSGYKLRCGSRINGDRFPKQRALNKGSRGHWRFPGRSFP